MFSSLFVKFLSSFWISSSCRFISKITSSNFLPGPVWMFMLHDAAFKSKRFCFCVFSECAACNIQTMQMRKVNFIFKSSNEYRCYSNRSHGKEIKPSRREKKLVLFISWIGHFSPIKRRMRHLIWQENCLKGLRQVFFFRDSCPYAVATFHQSGKVWRYLPWHKECSEDLRHRFSCFLPIMHGVYNHQILVLRYSNAICIMSSAIGSRSSLKTKNIQWLHHFFRLRSVRIA